MRLFELFFEAVLQTDGAVEYQCAGLGVLVGAEVAQTQELEAVGGRGFRQAGLQFAVVEHFQRAGQAEKSRRFCSGMTGDGA